MAAMTGVAGLKVMGPEAGTRLDRPGVPAGVRTIPAGVPGDRRRPDGTPDKSSHQPRSADIVRQGAVMSVSQETSTPSVA